LTPRITIGKGISGAVRYAEGEGRDPVTRQLKKLAPGEQSRVEWFGGIGFKFEIKTEADADLARRVMEFDALNQKGQCRLDCVHLSLSWRPGEKPTREHMEEQVISALAAIGMANAKALYFSHRDEDYRHIHIVASKINPATGFAYDLKGNYLQLSTWAEQYEREHGGIISTRRETNNELRKAIAEHDAGAVLEAMTKQRATFTPLQLDNALAKQIKNESERADFTEQILGHHAVVHLAEKKDPDGPTVRYSTRAVIEAEQHVLRAAESLKRDATHDAGGRQRDTILKSAAFQTMTIEQLRAFRHVTGPEGLALIDGQAGTGKSYTIAAVREAYERAGRNVIGLGPTNPVAEDMKGDGFRHAATIHSELFALNNGRRSWNANTVVIVDEAAMIDTKLMAMVTAWAVDSRAKLILVGDDRQLSSIDAGGMYGVLKDRYGAAALSEVKRQHKLDDRRASEMMAEGNYHDALNIYDRKGAIHWTRTQPEARAQLVDQWTKDSAEKPDKTGFVFAYTNDDVATLNAALRAVRKGRGELGGDHEIDTAHGRQSFATGDRIQFTGTDKKQGIHNGRAGTIAAIDGTHIAVRLDGRQPKTINFDAANFDKFRHGYAGTIYKAQGRTLDQTYLYHSEHWRSAASYVALTRHRDKTELFVATNTAAGIKELARQMARTDDRRAASQFHYRQDIPVPALTAPQMLARFSADMAPHNDSRRKRKKMAIEREDATDPATIKRQIDDQQDLAAQAKERTELSERFLAGLARDQQEGAKIKEAEQQARQKAAQDDDITDARSRYLLAAEDFDIRRPYASLSEIAGAEGAMFQREQEKLKREAALERDPDKREMIDLRRQIEANEYMAITSERLAGMSRVITGNSNSEESQRQTERAEYFAAEALELRRQRQELQERIEKQEQEREMQRIDQRIETTRRWLEERNSSSTASPSQQSSTPGAAAEQDNQAEGWRPLGPEEVLQPGAHVRVDLQTGQSQVRGEANAAPETRQQAAETREAEEAPELQLERDRESQEYFAERELEKI
jgi:Ti-type conjugative transfer relaxase TraA